MIDRKDAANAPLVGAFKIEAHGLLAEGVGVAIEFGFWRVVAVALTALKALAASPVRAQSSAAADRLRVAPPQRAGGQAVARWWRCDSQSPSSKLLFTGGAL